MVDHPVQQDSKYRVAFDLALRIHTAESSTKPDAAYWLRLFEACLTVVNHGSASEAINQLPKK